MVYTWMLFPVYRHLPCISLPCVFVCFEERSKMGLSCPHFILFPKGGGVKLRCVLVRCGRDVWMTLVENRAVDLFFASD